MTTVRMTWGAVVDVGGQAGKPDPDRRDRRHIGSLVSLDMPDNVQTRLKLNPLCTILDNRHHPVSL